MTFEINTDYKKPKDQNPAGEVKGIPPQQTNPSVAGVNSDAVTHARNFDIWSAHGLFGGGGNKTFANAGGASATVPQPTTTNTAGGTNTVFDTPPVASVTTTPIQKTEIPSALKGVTGKDNPQPAPTATEILNNVYDGYNKFLQGEEIA